jgi:hypothetical protein
MEGRDASRMGLYAAKNAVYVAAKLQLGGNATRLFLHMALECWDDDDNPGQQGSCPRSRLGFLLLTTDRTPRSRRSNAPRGNWSTKAQ